MSENLKKNRGGQCGVDLSSEHARLVEMPNAIPARYDRGITKHKFECTGVCEVIHIGSKQELMEFLNGKGN